MSAACSVTHIIFIERMFVVKVSANMAFSTNISSDIS